MSERRNWRTAAVRIWMVLGFGLALHWTMGAWAQESSPDTREAVKTEPNPSGTWKWEREFRDTVMRNTLKLKKGDGDKLDGTLQTIFGDGGGPGGDPVKIENGKADGDKITFSVTRNFNGNEFTIDYVGKYSKGQLGGTYTLDFGNGSREIEWKAKRHVDVDDVVGKWNLAFESRNGQRIESSMTIKKDEEDKLAGTYHSGFFGDSEMKNLAIKESAVSWSVVFETDNGQIEISYSGKPVGSSMKGTITSEFGGEKNENLFEAKLEKKQAAKRADSDEKEKQPTTEAAADN